MQPAILQPPPPVGRHLTFDIRAGGDLRSPLARLTRLVSESTTVGFGPHLVTALGATVAGLRPFPALAGAGVATPSTQNALWFFIGDDDASRCFDTARAVERGLGADFTLVDEVGTFVYRGGRDLSGYEDGTENPHGDHARKVAIINDGPLAGSSFAAVQRWVHDLASFQKLQPTQRDFAIGRYSETNDEIPDAPASAHVRRSAQESFDPEAFMVRRSMPWSEGGHHGLYFLAFGDSLDRFERVLKRMVGLDDGVVDGLFAFTRPVSGGYYWCPPRGSAGLDLSAVGL